MKTIFLILQLNVLVYFNLFGQNVLVISGGGARGAWGGGVAESLSKKEKKNYKFVVGTSTGSLLAPFIITKDFEKLRRSYTNVNQKDIFNSNPFHTKGAKVGKIKNFHAFLRVLFGARTLGESKNLRKLIDRDIPIKTYEAILDSGNFIVTTVNFNTGAIEYFSNLDYDTRKISLLGLEGSELKKAKQSKEEIRNQMLDWIWASANQPVLMSMLTTKDSIGKKQYWVDGGIRENVALVKGLDVLLKNDNNSKNDTLDVIVNNTYEPQISEFSKPRIINGLLQIIDIFSYDSRSNDVRIPSEIRADFQTMEKTLDYLQKSIPDPSGNNITVNFYFMKQKTLEILPQSLLFNQEKMEKLWKKGIDYENSSNHYSITISKEYAQSLVDSFYH